MNMDKFGYGVNVTLQTGLLLPSSVKIMHLKRHNLSDVDECARWGTYCAQQCKNVKGSYKCLCTDGFHDVKGKGTHCKPKGGQLLIFFTSGHEVRQVIPDKKAYSGTLSWGRHMGALDVDVDRRLLYFSDLSLMKIERAGIPDDIKNGGPPRPQDLNADVTQVEGIAIDWVTKNIYWTDLSRRTISVALDDGRYQKTLIRDDLVHPLAIIVNPKLGLLYWTDAGSTSPKIEQAWMTGEERSVLVFTRLGRPTGLTLDDHMDDRLYWCDSKENLIESIKLDGSDRVIVVGKGLDNPVSLDVFGDSLYWASQQMGAVMKMDKFWRGVNVTLQTGLLLPSSVRIMHPKRHNLSVKNRCSDDDSEKCSHLCLLKPDGAACACPDRSQFIDDSMTQCDAAWESSKPSPSKCSCLNNGICVMSSNRTYSCHCVEGYTGRYCEVSKPIRLVVEDETPPVTAIIIPILVISVVICGLILFLWILKKRGKLLLKAKDLKPGVGTAVTYREGGNIQIASPPFTYDQTATDTDTTQPYSPGIPGSPEGGVAFTTFSNPMYFKEDKGEKSSPPPSPVTTKSGGDGSHDNPTFDDVNFNGDST